MNFDYMSFIAGVVVVLLVYWVVHYWTMYRYYKGVAIRLSQSTMVQTTAREAPEATKHNPIGFLWDGK